MPEFTYVLLPGLDGTGGMFAPLLQAMPADTQSKVISYPPLRLDYADLLRLVVRQLPRNKPLIIIAESFSGPILVDLLGRKAAANVHGAIFCASFVRNPHPVKLFFVGKHMVRLFTATPILRIVTRILCMGLFVPKAIRKLYYSTMKSVPVWLLAFRLRLLRGLKLDSKLKSLSVPCCYLQGRYDRLVPDSARRDFKNNLPTYSSVVIDGPHFLLQTRPQVCWEAIQTFSKLLARQDRYRDLLDE